MTAEKMTPVRAAEVMRRHLEAVGRGDPEALKLDREVGEILRAQEQATKARRRRLDALAVRLGDLTDKGLAKVEALVETLPRRRKAGKKRAAGATPSGSTS